MLPPERAGSGPRRPATPAGRRFGNADELADAVLGRVGKEIVLGLPVGLGKAVHVANALFARAVADSSVRLTIFSALTLETPRAGSDLERRFLEPLAGRLFSDWPTLDHAEALRRGDLPPNVTVREFYFRPAAYLDNALAQQNYTSINYSQVTGELIRLGVNVIAQLVAARPGSPETLSLASNPEITLELLPWFKEQKGRGGRVALVGQVNRRLPFMSGDAELARDDFDFLLDADSCDFEPFGIPNRAVGPADYATGMHVASLVPDGGTLQIGIGSLSDAVAHCLRLRHERPGLFREVLERLPGGGTPPRETGPFTEGLYACSELMSDALFSLFEAGIVRRPADENDPTVIHAGFFVGSDALYEALRALPEARRRLIGMTRISFVNTLYGDEAARRAQRRGARFVNETMMVTLLGAAVSDALEDGRVVSGVGGQFDFVSMAQALTDARSILMLRARRLHEGRPESNVRWNYGHVTVPRHHRDLFVSEYGVAATRGLSDRDVIAAMLGIADSEFQEELRERATAAGKLEAGFRLPAAARNNEPRALEAVFGAADVAGHFPPYPLGSALTDVEQELAAALSWLAGRTATLGGRAALMLRALPRRPGARHEACLERLDLDAPRGLRERLLRRLVVAALDEGETA